MNVNALPMGGLPPGSGANSGEDEDEVEVEELVMVRCGAGVGVGGRLSAAAPSSLFAGGFADRDLGRMRTLTGSAMDMGASGAPALAGGGSSAAFTTADLNAGGASPGGTGGAGPGASGGAKTPVTVLPTSDAEAQIGLAKVAEADVDASMTYAAIMPEYCRLEGMLCKSLV
ncbi:hypothetical protein ID866_12791 [Astraeus odoratus]|nr:hypothetical protein ID866_12791 [Astraeus odoratus]